MCRFSFLFAEWSVVHGKCFSCKLYPRCVHTEISTFYYQPLVSVVFRFEVTKRVQREGLSTTVHATMDASA